MKINVIGFAIIRGKYTVIYYEKNTKNVSGAHYRDIVYGNYSNVLKIMLSVILIRIFFYTTLIKQFNPKMLLLFKHYSFIAWKEEEHMTNNF